MEPQPKTPIAADATRKPR